MGSRVICLPGEVPSKDYMDFVFLWIQQGAGVHQGELLIYYPIYPVMVRHCRCCQASETYAHRTLGLCLKCCEEQVCLLRSDTFAPSRETVAASVPRAGREWR